MKRILSFVLVVLVLAAVIPGCGDKEPQVEYVGPDNAIYDVVFGTIETVCEYSNTIVKARYVGMEEVDWNTGIYMFELEEDFTGRADEEILHVYEDGGSSFIEGKSYYLFMTGNRLASYPHIKYVRQAKSLLIGEDMDSGMLTFYNDISLGLEKDIDFSEYLREEIIAKELYEDDRYIASESLESAVENTDVVLVATVDRIAQHELVNFAYYSVEKVLKGEFEGVSARDSLEGIPEDIAEQIREVAGTWTPNVIVSKNIEVGEKLIVMLSYSKTGSGSGYNTYSGEHSYHTVESESGQKILELFGV